MKKISLIITMACLLIGCGNETSTDTVDGVEIQEKVIDIDISIMSEIMAYAQANNIATYPEEFLGDVIKIRGEYFREVQPLMDMDYSLVLLMDDTNCCQAFLEIELPSDAAYPNIGSYITVTGELKMKTIDGYEYPYIDVTDYQF